MNNIKNKIYSEFHSSFFEKILIKKRLQFLNLIFNVIDKEKVNSVLDIGTTSEENFESSNLIINNCKFAKVLNCISDQEVNSDIFANKLVKSITDDFTSDELTQFKSDLVISNAVIEHVGNLQNQIKMVSNIIKLSKNYIVIQTVNRWFPFEVHSKLPLLHWLPTNIFRKILKILGYNDLSKEENLNLMDYNILKNIIVKFNKSVSFKIYKIKTFGFTSNFIVVAKKI